MHAAFCQSSLENLDINHQRLVGDVGDINQLCVVKDGARFSYATRKAVIVAPTTV